MSSSTTYHHTNFNTSKFIDIHSLGRYSDKELKGFHELPIAEYGVKVLNIFYNRAAGISFCYLEAPTRDAIEKHHEKYGVKCNWITELRLLLEQFSHSFFSLDDIVHFSTVLDIIQIVS